MGWDSRSSQSCSAPETPRSHLGQRTAGADTDQEPARGERPGCDVPNSSGGFFPKILRIWVKGRSRDHFKSVGSHQSAWELLKASRSPRGPDAFPRSLQGFLKVFSRFSFPILRDFKEKPEGNVCSGDERLVANLILGKPPGRNSSVFSSLCVKELPQKKFSRTAKKPRRTKHGSAADEGLGKPTGREDKGSCAHGAGRFCFTGVTFSTEGQK